ncbi:Leukotriene A-4 hydrolase [Cyphomyrmex costatus]|uniref:Leukotriene A-4 hydrolase n=1 Tax=Cyphomyrmex costatus TaxID=456900 RepID=A0A151IA30_9HYME|nr:Leukotriene A-4 hydrolase [Cyphomyrmex costatus]
MTINYIFCSYKIRIEYKTRKDSLALYWLRSDQTSDGTHPFLLTNNQFTNARGIFPCQDSPEIRFTYTAKISVSKAIRIIVGGRQCKSIIKGDQDHRTHIFYETNPMPSYAIIIMAGSLMSSKHNNFITLWAEEKHFMQSKKVLKFCKHAINITNELCGFPIQDEFNICVLPSNIPEIELQCRTMIFVSSTLLDEDPIFMCDTIARKIAQSWAGGLVTCRNFQHLWLIKSFSIFISSKILQSRYRFTKQITFMRKRIFFDLNIKMRLYGIDSQQKLVPSLTDILPKNITKSVPDEVGYYLLDSLQKDLGGSTVFAQYLKHYMQTFCYQSIDTFDWKDHLFSYFDSKHEILISRLDKWLYKLNLVSVYDDLYDSVQNLCEILTQQWITTNTTDKFSSELTDILLYDDIFKMYFLNYLYASPIALPIGKLDQRTLQSNTYISHIFCRFLLLSLYIRNEWEVMVHPALKFAREYCASTFACPIFHDLYKLEQTRGEAISGFTAIVEKKSKMLPQTMEDIASVLKINLKDIYKLISEESTSHVRTDQ